MPLPRLARAGAAPRGVLAALTLALCAALLLTSAAPAGAVTRKQASAKAIAALGVRSGDRPVVVFGLPKPLRKGTRVTQAGSGKAVAVAGRGGSFFFYEDSAPGKAYPHSGRVVLVGAGTGKAKVSRTIARAPRVGGELPAFLTSSARYNSPKYRVFQRAAAGADAPAPDEGVFASDPLATDPVTDLLSGPNSPPKAHPQDVIAKQDRPKTLTLTGSDDDGEMLVFEISRQPDHGTLSGQPPDVVYTPNPGFLGRDAFSFKVTDDTAHSNTAKVSINVIPVGQPPSVATSGGCTGYAERGPAVTIDGALAVADPDDANLDSARVRITTDFVRGDDLVFTDQNGITGSYDDTTGVLALSGTAPVATYEAALRTVGYRNLAGGSPSATKDVEFTVNDAGSDSAPAVKQLCISHTGPNSRPIGETSEGALLYVENDGPLPVDGAFTVIDTDSNELSGATVRFTASQPGQEEEIDPTGPGTATNGFAPAEDELTFFDQSGISGSYDDTTGVLTLSGTATVADYEAALRSVTYENSSEDPSAETRALRFQVTDSSGSASIPSGRGILVTPVNDAPVATASEGSADATGEAPATVIDGGLTAIDVDDDDLEGARVAIASGFEAGDELAFEDAGGISGSYDDTTGVLTLSGTAPVAAYESALRTVEYRHDGNPSGARSVEFTVNDGDLDSAPAARQVDVNDAPVLDTTDAAQTFTEGDGAVAVDPGIAASDADSATLAGATVQLTEGFSLSEDSLAFTDQNGIAGFYDEESGILTLSGTASVADYVTALRSVTFENDSEDPSGTTRTVVFRVDDGAPANNVSEPASRDVAVTPVNDAPALSASAGSVAYTEGDAATTVDDGIAIADVDDDELEGAEVRIASGFEAGDDLVFVDQNGISGTYNPGTGVLTLSGTATVADYETALRSIAFSGTSDAPATSKSVEFTVNDGDDDSAAAARSIDVTPVNDAPSVSTSSGSTAYTEGDSATTVDGDVAIADADDSALEGALVRIASGFDAGDELFFVNQNGIDGTYNPGTGVLTLSGTATVADYETALRSIAFSGTSDAPATSKSVEFTVNDGDDDSAAAARSIDVTAVDDAPSVSTSSGSLAYTAGDPAAAIDPALTAADADGTELASATVRIASGFEDGDELAFEDQNGIAGTYDTSTGVLTLSGTATVADYEAALRSVAFSAASDAPAASRAVEFTVNDGELDSATAAKPLDVSAAPPPPDPEPEP